MKVLLQLLAMSLRGRIVRSVRLLKQPKYLIGTVIGGAWLGYWILVGTEGGRIFRNVEVERFAIGEQPGLLPGLHLAATIVVTFILGVGWLIPFGKLGLPFKEAELHLLLPAPVSRRQLISYGLLKSQPGVAFGAAIFSLFLGGGSIGERLLFFLSAWLFFTLWDFNTRARGMFLLRQRELPVGRARARRMLLTAGIVSLLGFIVYELSNAITEIIAIVRDSGGSGEETLELVLDALLPNAALERVLAPVMWATAPLFAVGMDRLLSLLPLLLLTLAQYEAVIRSRARFEEPAMEQAKAEEQKKSPTVRFRKMSDAARRRQPFALHPLGTSELGIVWKNLLIVGRWRLSTVIRLGLWTILLLGVFGVLTKAPLWTFTLMAMAGMVILITVPLMTGMLWTNDLRRELLHLELVRTWPISAVRFVMAQVLSPALLSLVLAIFGAVMVMVGYWGARMAGVSGGPSPNVLPLEGTSPLGAPYPIALVLFLFSVLMPVMGIALCSSALQNLAALFVPAWMAYNKDAAKGLAVTGQRMLIATALGLSLLLLSIPSALLVGVSLMIQGALDIPWSAWELPLWGLLAAIPYAIGAYLIVLFGAQLWRSMDPSKEILEIGR